MPPNAPAPDSAPASSDAPSGAEVKVSDADEYTRITSKQTTGGHVWNAARVLHELLSARPELLRNRDRARLLELGSGTGWLGMTVAREFANLAEVCLTEMEDGGALAWLEHNVQQNQSPASLRAAACDWGWYAEARDSRAPTALASTPWDVIIGSDLVYNEHGVGALPRVLAALATPRTLVLYAHTLYRFEHMDRDFFDALTASGLAFTQIWPSPSDRSESPPPFNSLFAEERIAVFCIEKGGKPDEAEVARRGNPVDDVADYAIKPCVRE